MNITAFGIQQCDLKMTSILNILALLGLLPTFYFAIESLVDYSRFYLSQGDFSQKNYTSTFTGSDHDGKHEFHNHQHHQVHNHHLSDGDTLSYDPSSITTIWTLSWLELFHLIPMAVSILYLLFLYRHLSYYTHY